MQLKNADRLLAAKFLYLQITPCTFALLSQAWQSSKAPVNEPTPTTSSAPSQTNLLRQWNANSPVFPHNAAKCPTT
jgi:hypothetical protein